MITSSKLDFKIVTITDNWTNSRGQTPSLSSSQGGPRTPPKKQLVIFSRSNSL